MLAGTIALAACYAAYGTVVWWWLGVGAALAYVAALPIAGLVGHKFLRALRRYGGRLRTAGILLQVPIGRRSLIAMRRRLIQTIEGFRADYARTLVPELDTVLPVR
jgi:hypothetical protein